LLIVPPVGILLAKHPLVDQINFSSVTDIVCAAAPLGPETEGAIKKRIGLPTRQGYGMTELSPAGTILPLFDTHKPGSVGVLLPGAEGKVNTPAHYF
jgi:long-subunit acyl-CoA synthetase (AMP-forming)